MIEIHYNPVIPKPFAPLKRTTEENGGVFRFVLRGGRYCGKTTTAFEEALEGWLTIKGAHIVVGRYDDVDFRKTSFAAVRKALMKFGISPHCKIPERVGDIVFLPLGNIIRFQAVGGDEHRTKGLEFEFGYVHRSIRVHGRHRSGARLGLSSVEARKTHQLKREKHITNIWQILASGDRVMELILGLDEGTVNDSTCVTPLAVMYSGRAIVLDCFENDPQNEGQQAPTAQSRALQVFLARLISRFHFLKNFLLAWYNRLQSIPTTNSVLVPFQFLV